MFPVRLGVQLARGDACCQPKCCLFETLPVQLCAILRKSFCIFVMCDADGQRDLTAPSQNTHTHPYCTCVVSKFLTSYPWGIFAEHPFSLDMLINLAHIPQGTYLIKDVARSSRDYIQISRVLESPEDWANC